MAKKKTGGEKKATTKKKSTSTKKKTTTKKKASAKGIKFDDVVFDDKSKRPADICICINGNNIWFPRKEVKINKSAKTVEMPKWLEELKIK